MKKFSDIIGVGILLWNGLLVWPATAKAMVIYA